MTLEMRRKRAAAAAADAPEATPTPKATKAAAAPKRAKKRDDSAGGSLKSIAHARAYQTNEAALDDDGKPVIKALFSPQGSFSEAIDDTVSKDRVVPYSTFLKHFNSEVCEQVFGVSLRQQQVRMLLDGLSMEILDLVERGYKVKLNNLVSFNAKVRKARKARNPKTGESVQVGERTVLQASAARGARAYLNGGN